MTDLPNFERRLLLELNTHPSAPPAGFSHFIVGDPLVVARNQLRTRLEEMMRGERPSLFQLVIAGNGNGKTLLNNMTKEWLSNNNSASSNGSPSAFDSTRFRYLYSHITDLLGMEMAATTPALFAQLRRSQIERPEYTYELIAAKLVSDFQGTYHPPFWARFGKAVSLGMIRIATLTAIDQFKELDAELSNALKDGSDQAVQSALDKISDRVVSLMTHWHFKEQFLKSISDLEIKEFVRIYFERRERLSHEKLRTSLLNEIRANALLTRPHGAVRQICYLAKKMGTKVVVIMIDDCNDEDFAKYLLPLIYDLPNFDAPRVAVIVSMVEAVANDIINRDDKDETLKQRLKFNAPIRLPKPTRADIEELFEKIRVLYNASFMEKRDFVRHDPECRARLVREWECRIRNNSALQPFNDNYRDAIKLCTDFFYANWKNEEFIFSSEQDAA